MVDRAAVVVVAVARGRAVVVVLGRSVARSGPTTTTTSAVPIELIGAAVVYGATALEGRCSDEAMASGVLLEAGDVVHVRRRARGPRR